MGPQSRETWAQRLGTFRASPSAFMEGPEGEDLARDLLSDLRSEKLSEPTKVGPARVPNPGPGSHLACRALNLNFLIPTGIPPFPGFLAGPELGVPNPAVAGRLCGRSSRQLPVGYPGPSTPAAFGSAAAPVAGCHHSLGGRRCARPHLGSLSQASAPAAWLGLRPRSGARF